MIMIQDPPLHIRPLAQPQLLDQPGGTVGSILLIHGFADSPYSLRNLAAVLHGDGYRVLLMRLPGHGAYLTDLARATMEDWRQAVAEAVHSLEKYPGPIAVLGRSFGGVLGLLACTDAALPIRALVTLATPHPTQQQRALRYVLPLVGLFRKTIPKPWVKPEERVMRYEVGRYVAFPIPALREFFRTLLLLTPEHLHRVTTPTLILHGEDDSIADPAAAKYLYDAIGSTTKKLCLIPGVGHSPETLHTHPKLLEEIRAFLKTVLH